MPKKKPTWVEKLNYSKGLPKVEKITDKMSKRWGTGTVVIPAPIEVDEMMRKVPAGNLTTINEIRAALAKKHKATIGCPLNKKYPGGAEAQKRRLEREGHTVIKKGKKYAVLNYEKVLVQI